MTTKLVSGDKPVVQHFWIAFQRCAAPCIKVVPDSSAGAAHISDDFNQATVPVVSFNF